MASLKGAVSSDEGDTSFYASHKCTVCTAQKVVFNGKTLTCLCHHYFYRMLVHDDYDG